MKRITALIIVTAASSLGGGGCAADRACKPCACACAVPPGQNTPVSTKTAEALREALQDERRVQEFYQNVMTKYGTVRPFSNIVHAEARHEAVVASLMNRHGVPVPTTEPTNIPAVPDSLAACNRVAAQLERENIAMYDRLIGDVNEPDIRAAFQNLKAASKDNHLPAFERWSS